MAQTRFSLSETKDIQEEARKKYANGQYSLADYLEVILSNPLKFTSAIRTRATVTKKKGKFRVTATPTYQSEEEK